MARSKTPNPVVDFGQWLAETPSEWPEAAIRAAHHALIDVIGVAVLGVKDEAVAPVLETVRHWGAGPCTAIGAGARFAAPWAAMVNGTAAHALDFDDNFDPGKAHASAVLVPAILALAEQERASGAQAIDAFIAGLQILGRVGEGLNPRHRQLGWHATATVGAVGAAAACARLLRLDTRQAAHALSIATSMAGGFIAQFGTMTKPLHAGLAAKAGVLAASLARAGLDAGADTLDGPKGMRKLMAGLDPDQDGPRFRSGDIGEPLLILSEGLRAKRFPNCGSAHRSMDGLLELRGKHGFSAADVDAIRVHAPRSHLANLMYPDPQSPAQAKFSLPFALAAVLVDGNCTLSHFTDDAVARPDLHAIYPLVSAEPLDDTKGFPDTRVAVALKDGRTVETALQWAVGSKAKPFTAAQYREKFDLCVRQALPEDKAEALRDALERLPELGDISGLMRPLA
ncbi:MAG TPA: MmgE/PrpD family protein [Novosphingobium sp.]|nr:MmgE/PrpD family protein [Novosphingobium sp.]